MMRYFRRRKESDQTNDHPRGASGSQHPLFAVLEAEDRRVIGFQCALFAFAVLTLGSSIELLAGRSSDDPAAPAPQASCPRGQLPNLLGECIDASEIGTAQSCATKNPKTPACECDGGRVVDGDNLCVFPAPRADRCDIARGIKKKCDEKRGGKISTECSATELFNHSALDDQDTEALLASFPDTITVHFDENQPRKTSPPKVLVDELTAMRSVIEGCGEIFLLGRADVSSGSAADNDKMAQRRIKLVRNAIIKASGLTGAQKDELNRRIHDFGLGSNIIMDEERFGRIYTKTLDSGDSRVTRILNDGLARLRKGTLSPKERTSLRSAINRSVQVIFVDSTCKVGAL